MQTPYLMRLRVPGSTGGSPPKKTRGAHWCPRFARSRGNEVDVLVEDRQHDVRLGRREPEHDPLDPELAVVLDLPGVRCRAEDADAQRGGITTRLLEGRLELRLVLGEPAAADRDPAVRVLGDV